MKPMIYIVGLGSGGLDKVRYETYKILAKADKVYIWTRHHPAVADMSKEGISCEELFSDKEEREIVEGWEEAIGQVKSRIIGFHTRERIVLALPGRPLREGRIIKGLQQSLTCYFQVDLSLLASDDSLARLIAIMTELRSPWGCPWDKEQDHQTLKKHLIEEAYEVLEAIDNRDMHNLCEELGDLLLQIVFHSQVAEEVGEFSFADVLQGISDKMIRRHPHIFGTSSANSSEEVLIHWEAIKKKEKENKGSGGSTTESIEDYFSIPKGLPALMMAEKTQKKAAKIGFDWDEIEGPLAKIQEEFIELQKETGNKEGQVEELGDLLFSIVNLSRFLDINAEDALRQGTEKFQKRFMKMLGIIKEERRGNEQLNLEILDYYWDKAKKEEKHSTFGSF